MFQSLDIRQLPMCHSDDHSKEKKKKTSIDADRPQLGMKASRVNFKKLCAYRFLNLLSLLDLPI